MVIIMSSNIIFKSTTASKFGLNELVQLNDSYKWAEWIGSTPLYFSCNIICILSDDILLKEEILLNFN